MQKRDKISTVKNLLVKPVIPVLTPSEAKFMKSHGDDCHVILIRTTSKALKLAESIAMKLGIGLIRVKVLPAIDGQQRGEIATQKDNQHVPKGDKLKTLPELGISRKESSESPLRNGDLIETSLRKDNLPEPEEDEAEPTIKPGRSYKLSFPSVWDDMDDDDDSMVLDLK